MADKGSQMERKLTNIFDSGGWAVMRAPASGSATERELPDLLIGNGNVVYAIEAKYSSDDYIYIQKEKAEALDVFARNFGAKKLAAVRFTYMDWKVGSLDQMYRTQDDGGNYGVKRETAKEEWDSVDTLLDDSAAD